MLKTLYLSIIFSLVVVGFGAVATAASLVSVERFAGAVRLDWAEMARWSGVTNPGWGGFAAITKTPNVGALGMIIEPEAYLKADFASTWGQAETENRNYFPLMWRSGKAGLDYPVYFVGGMAVQRVIDGKGGASLVIELPTPSWVEAGALMGVVDVLQDGTVVASPRSRR